jgi:hypothetical protein
MCDECISSITGDELDALNGMVVLSKMFGEYLQESDKLTERLDVVFSASRLLLLAGFTDMAHVVETGAATHKILTDAGDNVRRVTGIDDDNDDEMSDKLDELMKELFNVDGNRKTGDEHE